MTQGTVPYKEIFDHKGPLLYAINWLGILSGGGIGVWVIELISLVAAIGLFYKTARRFFSEEASFLGTFAAFIALINWFEGGNFTESYALFFIAGGMYCLTGYFVQEFELKPKQTFIAGLCMGAVLMLRINIIGVWVGMCAVIFVHTILIKKYKLLLRYVLFFILGIITAIVPFVIWLAVKGALSDFYYCYIEFNFGYIDVPFSKIIGSVRNIFIYPIVWVVTICLIIFSLWQIIKRKNNIALSVTLIGAFITTMILTTMSGHWFKHYYMAIVPCIVIPVALISDIAIEKFRIKPIVIMLLFGLCFLSEAKKGVQEIKTATQVVEENEILAEQFRVMTTPNEAVAYIGNWCVVYLMSERFPDTYYPYFSPTSMSSPEMVEKYVKALDESAPRVIMYTQHKYPKKILKYIAKNYTEAYTLNNTIIYERNEN